MSQISRRNFMKCAGAAALAIAASGILTGCDNTLDVEVTFVYNGQTLPVTGTGKVVTGEQYMDTGKNCGLDGQLPSGRERSAVRLC